MLTWLPRYLHRHGTDTNGIEENFAGTNGSIVSDQPHSPFEFPIQLHDKMISEMQQSHLYGTTRENGGR